MSLRSLSGRKSMFDDFRALKAEDDKMFETNLGFHQFLTAIDADAIGASPKGGGISPERTMKNRFDYKKVQKVKIEDIKDLAYEINLYLRLKNKSFEEIIAVRWIIE